MKLIKVWAVMAVLCAPAFADGWWREFGDVKEVTLGDLLRTPHEYLDVEVRFRVYFDKKGDSYNPYFTRFSEDMYRNVHAWPFNARLYEKRDFQRSYPLFFVDQTNPAWEDFEDLEQMQAIEIVGAVRDVFRGQPWIEIYSFDRESDGLDRDSVRRVIAGDAYFAAGRYRDAERAYDRALNSGLADFIRADILRRRGDSQYYRGDYRDARRSYRAALEYEPESDVLKRGLAAAEQAYDYEEAKEDGESVDHIQLSRPAPREQEIGDPTNDVDLIIAKFEKPSAAALAEQAEAIAVRNDAADATRAAQPREAAAEPAVEAAPAEVPSVEIVPAPEQPEAVEEPEEEVEEEPAPIEEPAAEDETMDGGMEQPAEDMSEARAEEPVAPVEEAPVAVVEEPVAPVAAAEPAAPVVMETEAEPFDDPRVVLVAGQRMRLPRLPFHGCEEVTIEDQMAVMEEIATYSDS